MKQPSLPSFTWSWWWIAVYLLTAILIVASGYWVYQEIKARNYTKVVWKVAIALLIFIIASPIVGWVRSLGQPQKGGVVLSADTRDCTWVPAAEGGFVVNAEKGQWTKVYCFHPGFTIDYRSLQPDARYKMKIGSREYTFTREKSDVVEEDVVDASFTAIGDQAELIEIKLRRH